MLNTLVSLLPFIFGASFYLLLRRRSQVEHDLAILVIMAYVGMLSVNGLFMLTKKASLQITGFTVICAFAMGALLITGVKRAVFLKSLRRFTICRSIFSTHFPISLVWIVGLLSFIYLGFSLFVVSIAPISAWDVLGAWSYQATQFIEQGIVAGALTTYGEAQNHPSTATTLLGWNAWAASIADPHDAGLINWLLAGTMLALVVGQALKPGFGPISYPLSVILILATPLLENHVVLPGYSEIWLTLVTTCSVVLIAESLETGNLSALGFGVTCAALAIFTRKTGIANLACILLALVCSASLFYLSPAKRYILAGGILLLAGALFLLGFSTTILGRDLVWSPSDMQLQFAGRVISITTYPIKAVIENEIISKFGNLSFSTYFLAIICSSMYLICQLSMKFSGEGRNMKAAAAFIMLSFYGYWLVLFLSQLLSADGFVAAVPGGDTGNSRFSLPLIGVGMVLVSYALKVSKSQPQEP